MKFRAENFYGNGKTEGFYFYGQYCEGHYIASQNTDRSESLTPIKQETLEIFLLGEWLSVSELENRCMILSPEDLVDDTRNDHL